MANPEGHAANTMGLISGDPMTRDDPKLNGVSGILHLTEIVPVVLV